MTVQRVTFSDGEWWEVDGSSHHIVGASAGLGVVWANGRIAVDPSTLKLGKRPRYFAHGFGANGYLFSQAILALGPAAEFAGAAPIEMAARS